MRSALLPLFSLAFSLPHPATGADLRITSPLELQVVQRGDQNRARIPISGTFSRPDIPGSLEARLSLPDKPGPWQNLPVTFDGDSFSASLDAPSGGWFQLDLRLSDKSGILAASSVSKVGVGEIFVVAGQSNSANHGEEKQTTKSGRVSNFHNARWQLANDPQPGASGGGGSFIPPLGDALAEKLGVPVGFVTCGIGATSVREWLPAGDTFPNPPTIEANVKRLPDSSWESNGRAYSMFTDRLHQLGPHGFRAVLWHQGESDANQKDPSRTLAGNLYRQYLENVIRSSRKDSAWDAPWFVAQVSYHVPGDEASPDIRAAQASLWDDGIALQGPDSDALKGDLRENGGRGVHFSGPGLSAHAAAWAEKITPWLERQAPAAP